MNTDPALPAPRPRLLSADPSALITPSKTNFSPIDKRIRPPP